MQSIWRCRLFSIPSAQCVPRVRETPIPFFFACENTQYGARRNVQDISEVRVGYNAHGNPSVEGGALIIP